MQYKPKNKKKNHTAFFLFTILTIYIITLSIGYAAMTSKLAIDGSAMIRPSTDVRITDYKVSSKTATSSSNSSSFTKNTVTSDNALHSSISTITYDVTVTNLSSNYVLVTDIKDVDIDRFICDYSIKNLTVNETRIPPASTYTFQIEYFIEPGLASLISGALGTVATILQGRDMAHVKSTIQFTFYEIPQYHYTINATPNDATITISTAKGVISSGTGEVTALLEKDTNLTWKVEKEGYYSQTGADTLTQDKTINIDLKEIQNYTFEIVPSPSDAIVTIKKDNEVLATGEGTQKVSVEDLSTLTYTISKYEYKTQEGTYTLNGEDYSTNITLTELPWIIGTYTSTDNSIATSNSDIVYHPGYYLIELYGTKGGDQVLASRSAGYGGSYGHVYGIIYLDYNTKIYYTLGGNGNAGVRLSAVEGGANNGGKPASSYSGSGGGYSAFAINTDKITSTTINNGNVLLISGGGGGGGANNSTIVSSRNPGDGGDGGTINSTSTKISIGTVFNGSNGTQNDTTISNYGLGGTTESQTLTEAGYAGSLLTGGASKNKGGAGGAGYYGGAGAGGSGTSSNGSSGGGGGSSFISNKITYDNLSSNITSKLTRTNPSSTGGSVIITYLGKTL